jgi:transposase
MLFGFSQPIWLYPVPIDFRKQMDGLIALVSDTLSKNPTSGQLFIFRSKSAKKLKMLWWDTNGFWLLYKRLEAGSLKFPPHDADVLELSTSQLSWLLSGLDCLAHTALPRVQAIAFY